VQADVKRGMKERQTKREKDDYLLHWYDISTRASLQRLTSEQNGARVAVRVHPEAVASILRNGRVLNAHDSGHRPHDRSKSEGYMTHRTEAERKVWNINSDRPEDHPIYGYVATDNEDLGRSIARAFGEAKLTLKNHVRPRTTVTYSDSMFVNIGNGDAIPSPINNPSHLSVVHWADLGGVEVPIAYKGEQPRPEPPLPPSVQRKIRDASAWRRPDDEWLQGDINRIKRDYFEKSGYQRWRHGDFIEAQIHGGIKLSDIERIEFEHPLDDPEAQAEVEALLEKSGIPYSIGPPKA
jgi:hypothetical protein